MAPRILVPFDDSDPADDALEHAFELFPDGEFVVLTVVDTASLPFIPNTADEADRPAETEELLADAAERLGRAESIADDRGVAIETQARIGTPAQEVLEYAERRPIDHVVIGSHGRSGVARILLGSVAEVVVRHSPVPVTVVR
ncbi:universal stress protein [Natrinema salaciae]|uniref:Nucleotide-binding universal stress protein, UspA family n=1 Tax=Natrinema salaciae TaxID=1186196 RepID=A0A1H9AZZ4_9EURY|nr:universal stress protein [Natrinema salaciae]SEP82057.1 Nucleotide-binding universal stress protein, UspA family [Natrinema salaciae]